MALTQERPQRRVKEDREPVFRPELRKIIGQFRVSVKIWIALDIRLITNALALIAV